VDFDDNASLDASQVTDARGRSFGGGGLAVGGGALGLVGLVVALLLGVSPGDLLGGNGQRTGVVAASDLAQRCRTGADADRDVDCRVVGVVNSIQDYWQQAFDQRGQGTYQNATTVLYSGATQTECGTADSSVGPFYCPPDKHV
jgi:predicted metalloprotease